MPTGRRSTTRPIGNIIGNISVSGLPLLLWILLGATHGYARVEITPCKNNFSPEQQVELGQKAAQQVYAEMPVLPDSNAVTKYVQKLGQKLAAQAPGHKWPYNFHVANVAEINAFALPGGTVFVNLGTIQAAANEAQLAGVMAHEIAHVVLQHSVCNAAKQQKVGLIAGIGQIAAGVLLGGAAGQIAQQGIGMTAGLSFLKMSRGAEKEADLLGVGVLYDAGYDPRAMPQFFETLQGKYGEGSAQFLSDHPNPGNRSEYVDKEIATFAPRGKYITKTPAFTKIKQTVAGMHAYTAREVSSGVWKKQTPNQTVGAGVNQPAGSANVDLNIPADWSVFRGSGFSIAVPANWQGYGNRVSAMIAPPGGIARSADGGAGAVVYGVLTDLYQPQERLTMDAALNALISGIARDNPGLSPGPAKNFTAGGIVGRSVECDNPSANNGKGERDWIIAFPQSGGILRYFVFVAPSSDFNKLRSVYTRMAQSIVLQ
jgi:beta-barrel assembly-enhancing protease